MNILIVNKYFFVSGGPERYMFSLIPELEARGHKVVPLALKLDENRPSPYSANFLESPFGSQHAKLGESNLGALGKARLALRSIYYPAARRAVARIIEQENIDVVYLLNICNYIGPSVISGAKDKGARVVMRLSDFNFVCASYHYMRQGMICEKCKQTLFNSIRYGCVRGSRVQSLTRMLAIAWHKYSGIYGKVDAFVCPSRLMMAELEDFGIRPERIHHLPSFVDMHEYDAPEETGAYVLYFGRLSREKGVDILLQAWRQLGSDAPPLRIIGSGEQEQLLRDMAASFGLNTVSFEPFLDHDELKERIRKSAFVVIPSVCHDNAPMAALEAMAEGKAIIASRVGGLPDQIEDKLTGLLVPAGNPQALADAVSELIDDTERLAAMGKAASLRVKDIFGKHAHLHKLLEVMYGNNRGNRSDHLFGFSS